MTVSVQYQGHVTTRVTFTSAVLAVVAVVTRNCGLDLVIEAGGEGPA